MKDKIIETKFLPAERESEEKLREQIKKVEKRVGDRNLLDVVPNIYLILNDKRQTVFANKVLLEKLNLSSYEKAYSLRPGELFDCVHAKESEGGCGTTEFCATCGAAQSILEGLNGTENSKECRIIQSNGNALDLLVWSSPIIIEEEKFLAFTVMDISAEKRKAALERIFFHDLLNTAGALRGWVSYLELIKDPNSLSKDQINVIERISQLSNEMVEEIKSQSVLVKAENMEYETNLETMETDEILRDIFDLYSKHSVAVDKLVQIDSASENVRIETDPVLLKRVLGNLIKNALEACEKGETVTVGVNLKGNFVDFWVHNPAYIPRHYQLQIFQRSFSTKGAGRGLGTYSVKLLTERYLKGKAHFVSHSEFGTTFTVTVPVKISG